MTDTGRKNAIRSLLIYFGVTFALSWGMFFAFILSGREFMDSSGNYTRISDILCTLGMLCPAAGAIITRYITKEGHKLSGENSLMLGIDLKNKKYLFYLAAVLLPWVYTELGSLLKIVLNPGCFDSQYFREVAPDERLAYIFPLMGIVSGVFFSICALGEELGWRGYMMPQMIKLFGTPKAIIIGGIIWGVWHWPLTYMGHNFGTDYKGYPFAGFAAMALLCIIEGAVLTFLTVKSGSVWPAAIMHAVGNTSPSILQFFINPEKVTGVMSDSVVSFYIHFIPLLIISVGICIIWKNSSDKAKQ